MPEYLHTTTEWYIKEEAMKICLKDTSDTLTYNVLEESQSYYIVDSLFGVMVVSKKEYEPVQEWEVVEETPRFYITLGNGLSHYAALPKDSYEPVSEWVDVTALLHDSSVGGCGSEFSDNSGYWGIQCQHDKGYRIRKISTNNPIYPHALVLERKKQ